MTIDAIAGGAGAARLLLNAPQAGNAANALSNTTNTSTAPDGTVTTTVSSPSGAVISVSVTRPSHAQGQAARAADTANGNALLDLNV